MPAGSYIQIYLPNVENPRRNWELFARVVTKKNRILQIISDASLAYFTNTNEPNSVTSVPGIDVNTFYSFPNGAANQFVYNDFTTTHEIGWIGTIKKGTRIRFELPSYDRGILPDEGHVTC